MISVIAAATIISFVRFLLSCVCCSHSCAANEGSCLQHVRIAHVPNDKAAFAVVEGTSLSFFFFLFWIRTTIVLIIIQKNRKKIPNLVRKMTNRRLRFVFDALRVVVWLVFGWRIVFTSVRSVRILDTIGDSRVTFVTMLIEYCVLCEVSNVSTVI